MMMIFASISQAQKHSTNCDNEVTFFLSDLPFDGFMTGNDLVSGPDLCNTLPAGLYAPVLQYH